MTRRLLVVDDEERIREVVRACLEDLVGWEVVLADSGMSALHQAKTEPVVDAILLDLSMPDTDGITLLKQLQAEPQTRSIPVILLTGHIGFEHSNLAQMGVAGVIVKPFAPIEIAQQIEQILGWQEG